MLDRGGVEVTTEDLFAALERTRVPPESQTQGCVAVLDHERARTRSFDVVFVLGLEEGAFPRRTRPSPLLSDELRNELGGRLERPDQVARDRYLFYTTCTRAAQRLVLVREAAGDEGVPREPSPFWEDVTSLFDEGDVQRATRRRPLSALTWPLEYAPSERERLRALVRLAADDPDGASSLAAANDWSRRLDRARTAFDRTTALRNGVALEPLQAKTTFSATELERFADCSSAWLVERVIDPKKIDAEPDPILRGQVLHTTLNRFYAQLPRELDSERVTAENLDAAIAFVHRCLDDALESGVRLDLTELQEAELKYTLRSDLEGFLRDEAASEVGFLPRRLEVAFGSDRAAPELQRGLSLGDDVWLSGKIDRIDIDPFSARGIVQDYKSGKGAHSARDIDRDLRLQIPLYILALRDLVGVEPLGGVYRAFAGRRLTRGMLRESARDDLPGFARDDYLDEDTFWAQVESARERAGENAQRIKAGDVRHDPKGDGCPAWCDLWPICRVPRA
jgi:ATP-dependent helicase/DNAse subunit B